MASKFFQPALLCYESNGTSTGKILCPARRLIAENPDFSARHIQNLNWKNSQKDFTVVYNKAWASMVE